MGSSLTSPSDIKATNILTEYGDEAALTSFEKAEMANPSPYKADGDRRIYLTRQMPTPKQPGYPILSDFGEARLGTVENDAKVQPELYRAPEVVLEMGWSYSIDIWSLGCLVSPLKLFSETATVE